MHDLPFHIVRNVILAVVLIPLLLIYLGFIFQRFITTQNNHQPSKEETPCERKEL